MIRASVRVIPYPVKSTRVIAQEAMVMDVFEMLGYVSGVAADEDYGVIVAWNGSATFNVFVTDGETFNNVDCRTVYYEADGSLSEIHDATANWGQRECERILAEIVNGEDEDDEDDE